MQTSKISFHQLTKQKPNCSLCSKRQLDARRLSNEFIDLDGVLVCWCAGASQSFTLNTHTKNKYCRKITGFSPKVSHFLHQKIHSEYTSFIGLFEFLCWTLDSMLSAKIQFILQPTWCLQLNWTPNDGGLAANSLPLSRASTWHEKQVLQRSVYILIIAAVFVLKINARVRVRVCNRWDPFVFSFFVPPP